MSKPISFDVGANDGGDTLWMLNHGSIVHAFEPIAELCYIIKERTKQFGSDIIVNQVAVSAYPGFPVYLNVAKDLACSSLNDFSEDRYSVWPDNRKGQFEVEEIRKVEAIRLDDYCRKNGISRIDWLHIDAQGHDIIVLKSLGEMLSIVQAGRFEVAFNEKAKLYKTSPTLIEATRFLAANGFIISKVDPELYFDVEPIEVDVWFKRAS